MRKRRLSDAFIQAEFRRLYGDDSARVTSAIRCTVPDYAVKFAVGPRHLTIAVPIEWMYRSIAAFTEQFTMRVVEIFNEHEQQDVPARSPGHVPVQSLGAAKEQHA